MKLVSTVLIALGYIASINAQSIIAETKKPLKEIALIEMPYQDNAALLEEELERRAPGVAPRFAVALPVDITPFTAGDWEVLNDGTAVWRLRIKSLDAHSLNFGFTEYRMPPSGKLLFYPFNKKRVVGPFTDRDNETHGQLWTPVIEGDEIVLEVQISAAEKSNLRLRLSYVNHDFLGFGTALSGSCNLDVICGADDGYEIVDGYRDIIQSVAVYGTGGTTFCTGALINTTKNDCEPYFLTANHCMGGESPASIVVYWNYVNSFCRIPNSAASGSAGDGVLTDFNTGAIKMANYAPSDFFLLKLDDPVSSTADAFFAGWSISSDLPADTAIVIHHPNTEEKRISFEFDALHFGEWGNGDTNVPDGDHVIIPDWDIGTTEGGSSGAPLFNRNKQIIGQLHGGGAACGNDSYDSFGWIGASWEGGGTPSTRLKDWLDPDNTGVTQIDGRTQLACSFSVIAAVNNLNICAPDEVVFSLDVSENFADDVTLSLDGLPDNALATFAENPVSPGGTTTLTISNTDMLSAGSYSFTLMGTDGTNVSNYTLIMNIATGVPTISGVVPVDGTADLPLNVMFGWAGAGVDVTYDFQLGTDAALNDLVMDESGLTTANISSILLNTQTDYFWRVRGINTCGAGEWGNVTTFSTGAIACGNTNASDLPIAIDPNTEGSISSVINYAGNGTVSDVQIQGLEILHTWVGDLSATLTSPAGTTIELFNQPGVPASGFGCGGDNVAVSFSDDAAMSADDLENSCGDNIALEGDFQPIDPFAAFIGENSQGDWVLTISDVVAEDGGSLESWSLFICTTVPDEAAIFPNPTSLAVCPETTFSFYILVGNGFEGQVGFSFDGLPEGTEVTTNPVVIAPGDNVEVTVSNLPQGSYTLNVSATDGTQNSLGSVAIDVMSPLTASGLLLPNDGEADTPTGMTFTWNPTSGASSYILTIASDSDFADVVFTTTTSGTSYNVTGLDFNQTYYWHITPIGLCGEGLASDTFSFSTIPDLSTTATPSIVDICQSGVVNVLIQPGVGFGNPASVSMQASSSVQPQVTYDIDPNMVVPGMGFNATISDFGALVESSVDLVFTISDGNYSRDVTVKVSFDPVPTIPSLIEPTNGATVLSAMVVFDWYTSPNASGYLFELATDEGFTSIVLSEEVTSSSYTVSEIPGEMGVYFWRVTAINDCGQATTAPVSFNYTTATYELAGRKIDVFPNPTSERLNISFSMPFEKDLQVVFFDITGKVLDTFTILKGSEGALIDVTKYPAGIYLLKISGNTGTLVERIVIEK